MADRSTLRKPVAFGTLAIAALIALGNWCYWKPHFWQLAVFPGISFLILHGLRFGAARVRACFCGPTICITRSLVEISSWAHSFSAMGSRILPRRAT
jgi:hypothetical protein